MISNSEPGSHKTQEVDLNLAPIIDCLTVLITFMLVTASFLSIGALEASIASPGSSADKPPEIMAEIQMKPAGKYLLVVSGKKSLKREFVEADMDKNLTQLKQEIPQLAQVTVTPGDDVNYDQVVKVIDKVKPVFNEVTFGGF